MIGSPSPYRRKPVCAVLSLAVPAAGLLLLVGPVRVPVVLGSGDFSAFAPAIAACLVALPLGLIGVVFAIAAFMRREKWIPAAVAGVILNLFVLSMFLVFALDL